ncbi:hypothetical protein M9Y10_037325 [Tritrichomonas musculus]|uniref:Protein kinase domain-containing protein n=1 Tax=Tritrichomonas musculus TaxID=1915356 RepID=A0ABR2GS86_9EUKA
MTNINSKKVLILQYFDGITLTEIKNMAPIEKMDLTIKIIIVLKYLHENNYIYRDLKPDNILIGKDQAIALIDLDRMIKFDQKNPDDQTGLASIYISPEIANGFDFSYSSDIYSLGMLLYFIFFGESPNTSLIEKKCGHYSRSAIGFSLCEIIYKCIREDPAKRPNINELASFFLDFYLNLANFDALNINFVNYIKCKYEYYVSFLNDPKAQLTLGCYYLNCQYSEQNIKKAIYYLTQAANQNDTQAQFMIGLAYFNGEYFVQDIDKAINFFTQAAENNHSEAQFYLGSIFLAGKYVDIDANKSIHYFMLAAQNNHPTAQYNIGYIYFEGKYVKQDIKKAIYYLKLSASQNFQQAQLRLGYIYSSAEYASYDIQEAIYYYSLAAEQNNSQALFFLGCMYFTDEHNIYDINKAVERSCHDSWSEPRTPDNPRECLHPAETTLKTPVSVTPDNPRECLHPAETPSKTPVSVTPTTTSYTAPPCRNDPKNTR